MQVKCICNKGLKRILTVGKVYDVIDRTEEHIKLTDDGGVIFLYRKERFENVPAEPSGKVMTCVNDHLMQLGITHGRNYNVTENISNDEYFNLINDIGDRVKIHKGCFIEPSQKTEYLVGEEVSLNFNSPNCRSITSTQIGGTHYSDLKIQPFEFIDKNNLTFFEGNVVKYLSRYNSKDGNKDIDKAIHYVRESFERLEHFQSRTIGMTAKAYCESNNLPPVVELVLCWILEYPISIEVELIVSLLQTLRVPNHEPPSVNLVSRPTLG